MINNKKTNESVKTISEAFFSWERDYHLFDIVIKGINIWEIIRYELFMRICRKFEILDFHQEKASKKEYVKRLPSIVINALIKNPLLSKKNKRYLFFLHARKSKINNEYHDIYTKYLIEEYNSKDIELLDRSFKGKHFISGSNISLLDALELKIQFNKKKKKQPFSNSEKQKTEEIEQLIIQRFGVDINVHDLIRNNIIVFKTKYKYYSNLLKIRKPEKVFLVVHYTNSSLIAACKDQQIPAIEIQHGTTSPYHLGYNFPYDSEKLKYFPDNFYAFGKFWIETINFPLKQDEINYYGFPHLINNIKKYNLNKTQDKHVLFISQGAIGKKLFRIAVGLAKVLDDYKISFKLHPGELDKTYYQGIIEQNNVDNLNLHGKETNLYQLINNTKNVVGVYSTALYEALLFKCTVYIANIDGVEYVENLIDKNYADTFDGVKELSKKIRSNYNPDIDYTEIFCNYVEN